MRYVFAVIFAVTLVLLLACNSKRMLAERRVTQMQEYYEASSREMGYQSGLADGINATLACVKIDGTNKPKVELTEVFDYARQHKNK